MKLGIALKFTPNENKGPMVLAKGEGFLGEKIKRIAKNHGVPIVEDRVLAEALTPVPIGQEIPENLYRAVASVFAFVLNQKAESN
ncbi:hypothetical protein EHQ64_15085 [Leptospira sarikeiensis]|uniref:Type III secretion protein n=1 Tax=Leptospira sarikeiensis TaxID=2484943 RepID=A0A4R9K163_9LEPT|nr:hypothetical protein EHQ64_15085 [Leptospira sarikeiensis]